MKILTLIISAIFLSTSSAQQYDDDGFEIVNPGPPVDILAKINVEYQKQIKPMFEKKCLSCHGINNNLPWYSVIPGISHLLEYDMREAKEHMDMSSSFPFAGHGSPRDDLKALARVVRKDEMPPLRYQVLHWDSKLTTQEKALVQQWIKDSLELLP
ncbi:MAG: hypothetical protein CME71_08250 [Halobacteriovorax sp.]|nr:hypothetical protein [Halobacteriovorax sp.]